jgi:hypothetical protein
MVRLVVPFVFFPLANHEFAEDDPANQDPCLVDPSEACSSQRIPRREYPPSLPETYRKPRTSKLTWGGREIDSERREITTLD